jgi:hypothetical protein
MLKVVAQNGQMVDFPTSGVFMFPKEHLVKIGFAGFVTMPDCTTFGADICCHLKSPNTNRQERQNAESGKK